MHLWGRNWQDESDLAPCQAARTEKSIRTGITDALVCELLLKGCPRRRFIRPVSTPETDAVADNLIKRDFRVDKPSQRWSSDITQESTQQAWLYLSVVADLYSRCIVGWTMDPIDTNGLAGHVVYPALIRIRAELHLSPDSHTAHRNS